MYTVETFSIKRKNSQEWETRSRADVWEFETLEEAKAWFDNYSVAEAWRQYAAGTSDRLDVKRCHVEACELLGEEDSSVSIDTLDYKEYTFGDYEKEHEE